MNEENDVPFIHYLNNLNGFTKNNCLSEGSFSTVYSVIDKSTENLFCVKSFEFDSNDPIKRKIFAKHANYLHNLDFPTLIPHQFFSCTDLDGQYHPSFIYPFYEKQSLKNNITKLNNTQIMIILTGIAEGIRYLHQNNITYSALEPSNILLDDQFRPILTSFGLDKMIEEFNSIDPQIPSRGSFNYLTPHYSFQPQEEFKCDIYAFGLIIYYLLVKKDPYSKSPKILQIPHKVVSGSLPRIPQSVPTDFANFIYRCLMQIPQERPSIQDVCKEITKLRLPNVDIEKINQYKEYLKKESISPFSDFKNVSLFHISQKSAEQKVHRYQPPAQFARLQREDGQEDSAVEKAGHQKSEQFKVIEDQEQLQNHILNKILANDHLKESFIALIDKINSDDETTKSSRNDYINSLSMNDSASSDKSKSKNAERASVQARKGPGPPPSRKGPRPRSKSSKFQEWEFPAMPSLPVNSEDESQSQNDEEDSNDDGDDSDSDDVVDKSEEEENSDDDNDKNEVKDEEEENNQKDADESDDKNEVDDEKKDEEEDTNQRDLEESDDKNDVEDIKKDEEDKNQKGFEESDDKNDVEDNNEEDKSQKNDQKSGEENNQDEEDENERMPAINDDNDNHAPSLNEDDVDSHAPSLNNNEDDHTPSLNDNDEDGDSNFNESEIQPTTQPPTPPKRAPTTKRKAKPRRRANPFSDSSQSPPVSDYDDQLLDQYSQDESDDESDSDTYSNSKRTSTKRTTSRSQPTKTKSKTKSKAKPKTAKREIKQEPEINKEEEELEFIFDMKKFSEVVNGEFDHNQEIRFGDSEEEKEIQDVISIQHPTTSSMNNKNKKKVEIEDEEDKYFSSLNLSTEMKKLVKSARSGNSESQNELGNYFVDGKNGIPIDQTKAFQYYEMAVQSDNSDAMINLGKCYEMGIGTEINQPNAFELYSLAKEHQNIVASFYLGHCYEEGIGCNIDKAKAFELYQNCYEKGIEVSHYLRCLLFGIGIESDPQTAYELLCNLDESQDSEISLLKGMYHEYILGIDSDINEAINCYNRSIEQGNLKANINLALLLLSGGITSPTKQRNKSNFGSISNFDYHSSNLNNTTYPNFDESIILNDNNIDPIELLINVSNDLISAKIILADCYLHGVGVDIDLRNAMRYYNNALSQHSNEALARFNYYTFPRTIKSINNIKEAAQSQNDVALVLYGRLIIKGLTDDFIFYNENHLDEALNLFKVASDLGSPIGMCQYGKTLLKLQRRAKLVNSNELFVDVRDSFNIAVDEQVENEAIELIKKAAEKKYKGGLYNYGRVLLERNGVIEVDNSDNNVILVKSDRKEKPKTIQINFDCLISDGPNENENETVVDKEQVRTAFSLIRIASDLGNSNARVLLALFMKHGTFMHIDLKGATTLIDLARKAGSKTAVYHYSRMFLNPKDSPKKSIGGNKEINSVLNELKNSINWEPTACKSKAMCLYGFYSCNGIRVRESSTEASLYWKNSSGYPFDIGTIFHSYARSCNYFADMLVCGIGVDRSKSEGIRCYRQALLMNKKEMFFLNHKSAYLVGNAYLKGKVVQKNERLGLQLIKLAAESEDDKSGKSLIKCADFFMNGLPGLVDENKTEAFAIYSLLAERGNDIGRLNVAKMLIDGIGVEKDEKAGLEMLKLVSDKNKEAFALPGKYEE